MHNYIGTKYELKANHRFSPFMLQRHVLARHFVSHIPVHERDRTECMCLSIAVATRLPVHVPAIIKIASTFPVKIGRKDHAAIQAITTCSRVGRVDRTVYGGFFINRTVWWGPASWKP